MTRPLRRVVERGFLLGPGRGWHDRLACTHLVHFDGVHTFARRCPDCPPGQLPGQLALWDGPGLPGHSPIAQQMGQP